MTLSGVSERGPLGDGYSGLFNAWLADETGTGAAYALRAALAAENPAAGTFLSTGTCGVVVTGQQPGFLGGPLYTLYKIATAVALAARRTSAGLPTIPVFWSGDDDSDLREAVAPLAWDQTRHELRTSPGRALARDVRWHRRMAGTLDSGDICGWAAGWLTKCAALGQDDLVVDLAALHQRACAAGWSLSRLNSAGWLRCFGDTGLVIISGNDPRLHETAGPLTRILRNRTPELADLARGQGQELVQAGWHAQLDERSLRSPWYEIEGDARVPLASDRDVPAGRLRPGVLMRSLVQDWLLNPVCVVVGPGEYAYLRQLEPLYRLLNIPRCPLVPRLGGTLVPAGVRLSPDQWTRNPVAEADALAQEFLQTGTDQLAALLQDRLGLTASRSQTLAVGRTRRWRRGLKAMLACLAAERSLSGDLPGWVCPQGGVQERTLAAFNALGLWGDPLLHSVRQAADTHIENGRQGRWQAMLWETIHPGDDS